MGTTVSQVELHGKPTMEQFQLMSSKTHFSAQEIQQLYNQFDKLSNSQIEDNLIDIHEFQTALRLNSNDFAQRIFTAFDSDGSTKIDFFEFIEGLSALSPKASVEEKAKFCFNVYDIDKNGFIDKNELKEVLTFSLCSNSAVKLSNAQLNHIIEATFKKMDINQDGNISLSEFIIEAKKNPAILSCVNLNISSILNKND